MSSPRSSATVTGKRWSSGGAQPRVGGDHAGSAGVMQTEVGRLDPKSLEIGRTIYCGLRSSRSTFQWFRFGFTICLDCMIPAQRAAVSND